MSFFVIVQCEYFFFFFFKRGNAQKGLLAHLAALFLPFWFLSFFSFGPPFSKHIIALECNALILLLLRDVKTYLNFLFQAWQKNPANLSIEPIKEGVLVKSEIQIQVLLMAIL